MTLRSRVQSAFTITELLVVVAVVSLLIAVGTPAVISSLRSINRSLADTQLRVAIVGARDAAIRNAGRGDAMAVFTFEPGQRTQVYICLYAGTIVDERVPGSTELVSRDIFVPDPLSEPIAMPNGWSVRGYVPAFTMADPDVDQAWYETTYSSTANFTRGNWVFPETGFFDRAEGDAGDDRQSFAIRFRSGTGQIATERQDGALVLLPPQPTAAADFRESAPFNLIDDNALDALDQRRFVVRALSTTDLTDIQRRALLGNESTDTALVRPITQIALYRESELAGALGVRLDRETRSLYRADSSDPRPVLVNNVDTQEVNDWMIGRPEQIGDPADDTDERATRVFTLEVISGSLRELAR